MKIKTFDDYHEINDTKNCYAIELGCFPPKDFNGYSVYFALFYNKKDKKPTFKDIEKSLFSKINFSKSIHYRSNKDISVTKEYVTYEVKRNL